MDGGELAERACELQPKLQIALMSTEPNGHDAELLAGYPEFRVLQKPVTFELWVNGKDLLRLPLTRRKRHLGRIVWATRTVLSQVFTVERRGRDLFAAAERLDLGGVVAKRKSDPHEARTVWWKVKNRAYTQAEGRWELFQGRS
jgi:hypothetical protein